ncbi:MAG: hypothetical protein RL338_629 [Chloroflexota bacterium]|jgi:hypothetical protein
MSDDLVPVAPRKRMDDPRWEPGMPVLDRQDHGGPARSVPETRPTPLQAQYVNLSVVVLLAGFVAITALQFGVPLASPLVKVPVLVGAPILILTTADASLRIWRSAWAWMPVDRGRGLFRLAWLVVALAGLAGLCAASFVVLAA